MTDSTLFLAGNTPDAPRSDLPELLRALAADLRAVDYTLDGVAGLLGESAYNALNRDQIIPALLATESAAQGAACDGGACRRRAPLAPGGTADAGNARRRPAGDPVRTDWWSWGCWSPCPAPAVRRRLALN